MSITFENVAKAWKKLVSDDEKLMAMTRFAPSLVRPSAIKLKNIPRNDGKLHIRFYGFEAASDSSSGIPLIKRMIVNWMKKISESVQIVDSGASDLNLLISTEMRFDEAAIPIYKRDPKTNKIKRGYKCIGGRKDGRRVSDPNACIMAPDIAKRIQFQITKRAKKGQSAKAKTRTKLTNIVSKRLRKANTRLKKARGL